MVLDSESKTAVRKVQTYNAPVIESQQYCTLSMQTNQKRWHGWAGD